MFGSHDLDPGFGSQNLQFRILSGFGTQHLDLWVWVSELDLEVRVSGFKSLGLGLSLWFIGIGSQDLDLRIWMSGFGPQDWISEFVCLGLGLRSCIFGFLSQDEDIEVWVSGFGSRDLGVWDCVSELGSLVLCLRI